MPASSPPPAAVDRLIDANLDRAREGLRVIEDWCRFGLGRADLVARTKDMRQRLGRCHLERYKLARHTATDGSAGLGHPAQLERRSPAQVVAANAGRVQEALRVLEEFGRASDPTLAAEAASLRYALYDLEVDLLAGSPDGDRRRHQLARCRLYLVTSPSPQLEATVAAALAAGVRLVQYRAKQTDDSQRYAEASALRQLCARHGALFLVNDRVDLALAVDADGVHLGQGDLPPALARRLLGRERLIGRSTHRLEQLHQAVADGCDYVGVGPVHATPTKPGRDPVGLAYVTAAAAASPIPCFAIGGIDSTNLAAVLAAGAPAVAVVRAITAAPDPGAATRQLLGLLDGSTLAGADPGEAPR
ncbi:MULTISPECIES: thiamine phosphate synthase [unclassified Synechococcus]|uniref:thiamine phosphate synthase n=1 Tax=unclassified Synechococcus TaxID=2626047 RepID=UPI0021A35F38|nr:MULTISPECIES: thiamine phosphate synthase [unclassified Synechococcus]